MRLYDVAVVTLAIDAPRKWTDNVLSQYPIPGVVSVRQGVSRGVSHGGLTRLALIRDLHVRLGIGVGDAVQITKRLLDSGGPPVLIVGQLTLTVDLAALHRRIDIQLGAALESAPSPRRGRPPMRDRR